MFTVEGPVKLKKWKLKSEGSSRALYEWILGKRLIPSLAGDKSRI